MRKKLQKLPLWLVMLIALVTVVALGYLDYITGDYSLLIFYAMPVALVGWCVGRWGAVVISVASGAARLASDYISYQGTSFKYWNSLQDMVFLLMVGLLIAMLKDLMADAYRNRD
jgi:K+-sensing histidine kinase KdpD